MRGRMVDGKPGAEQLHRAYDQKQNNRRLQGLSRVRAGETTASPRPLFVTAPPNSPPWNFLGPAPTATAAFGSNQQNYGPAVGRVTVSERRSIVPLGGGGMLYFSGIVRTRCRCGVILGASRIEDNRRVLAVLTYLSSSSASPTARS